MPPRRKQGDIMHFTMTRSLVVGLLATTLIAGCSGGSPADKAGASTEVQHEGDRVRVPDASPLRKALQIAAVQERDVERPITVPGVVEADPTKLVKIVPPVAGRIVHIVKRLGDAVAVGDALLV